MTVRSILAVLLPAITAVASVPAAFGDSYPVKPIRFVVPFPPGGNTDVLSRLLAVRMTETMKQQVVVDNRAGAGGTIGVALTAKSPADGYTLVMGSFGSVLLAQSLYRKLPYDPLRDLDPVILVATPPGLLVTHPSLPVRTPADLIRLAKSAPDGLTYASAGNASWNHLFAELFRDQAKIRLSHVPYKGTVPALGDVMGGRVELMFAPFPPVLPQAKAGRLRILGVTTPKRTPVLPDIPTIAEAGLPGYEAEGWFAVLAPRGTPADVLQKLNLTLGQILSSPEVREALAADGAQPAGGTIDDLRRSIAHGIAKWRKTVDALGLKL